MMCWVSVCVRCIETVILRVCNERVVRLVDFRRSVGVEISGRMRRLFLFIHVDCCR